MRRHVGAMVGFAVVPWISAGPHALEPPPIARPCRPSALRILVPPAPRGILQGATGSLLGVVRFRNLGPACSLLGRPGVRLVGNGAAKVAQRNVPLRAGNYPSGETPATVSLRALPYGAKAQAVIQWFNWCGPRATTSSTSVAPRAIVFTLPQGGSFSVNPRGAPRCDQPHRPTDIDVGPFEAIQPAPSGAHLPFSVHVQRPRYTVRAGRTLDYRVRLTSTSRRPFRFSSCPVYSEDIAATHSELHYLNCRPVGTIQPGTSTVFEIRLRVPLGFPRGRTGLFFVLASAPERLPKRQLHTSS